MSSPDELWNAWCSYHRVAEGAVPLFSMDERGYCATRTIGQKNARPVLQRHPDMEAVIRKSVDVLSRDWESKAHEFDGLIYMMLRLSRSRDVKPLYIGKAETFGKRDRNLSVNIQNIVADTSKFARWGDNYAYHIGDLSAACLEGHPPEKANPKYLRWAAALFKREAGGLRLREPVYFWAKAWRRSDRGIWAELSETRLAFLEYLLIGIASAAFGSILLNREGQSRATSGRLNQRHRLGDTCAPELSDSTKLVPNV